MGLMFSEPITAGSRSLIASTAFIAACCRAKGSLAASWCTFTRQSMMKLTLKYCIPCRGFGG